jgi:Fe-Mn family superoxide dismutase
MERRESMERRQSRESDQVNYQVRKFDLARVEGISSQALEDHLGLYKGYVENTNKLLEKSIRGNGNPGHEGWEHRLAFEFNGMVLHELFFESLGGPGSKMSASSVLAEAMDVTYGGAKAWRERFLAIAKTRGIGWVMSARDRANNRLLTFWIDEHHLGLPANLQPVVLLDLWEHAYLKDFGVKGREEYAEIVLNNLNWKVLESRCA